MRVSVEEKLSAILIADVADYERLIARDRAGIEAALQLRRWREILDRADRFLPRDDTFAEIERDHLPPRRFRAGHADGRHQRVAAQHIGRTLHFGVAAPVEGVVVHRPTDEGDLATSLRTGIPCTNLLRTLVDLGAVTGGVAATVEAAVVSGVVSPTVLRALLDRHARPGRSGVGALRRALERWPLDRVPDSVLEVAMARLLERHGLPPAEFHPAIAGYVPDFRHPKRGGTDGLGVVPDLRVLPHFDKYSRMIPDFALRPLVTSDAIVVGIDEDTALVSAGPDGEDGRWPFRSRGRQSAWTVESDRRHRVNAPLRLRVAT